jgi:hypothetical protein
MAHRVVILEQTPTKEVRLINHIEEDWPVARDFHDAMCKEICKRGGTILYSATFEYVPEMLASEEW